MPQSPNQNNASSSISNPPVGIQSRRKNGFAQPYDTLQMVTWCMFPLFLTHYYAFLYFLLWNLVSKIVLTITFSISGILLIISVYMTCSTDPADDALCSQALASNNPDNQIYCYFCEINVHNSSKHCRFCDKCIVHFDHHCKWLNTCIGSKNYFYFIATVASAFALTSHNAALSIALMVNAFAYPSAMHDRVINKNDIEHFLGTALSIEAIQVITTISAALFILLIAMIIQLAGFHVMLNYRKLSTYEYIVQEQKRARDRDQKKLQKQLDAEQARRQQDHALVQASQQIAQRNSQPSPASQEQSGTIQDAPEGASPSYRQLEEELSFHSNVHFSAVDGTCGLEDGLEMVRTHSADIEDHSA